MKETIICSAIYFNDGQVHDDQPQNIKVGFVVSGRRHNNCYATIKAIKGNEYESYLNSFTDDVNSQGFITSLNRYLNRTEAFTIAKEAKQLLYPKVYRTNQENILTSECLFITDWDNFKY